MPNKSDSTIALKKQRQPGDAWDTDAPEVRVRIPDPNADAEWQDFPDADEEVSSPPQSKPASSSSTTKPKKPDPVELTWTSGDFRPSPQSKPPYNGLKIVVNFTPTSDGQIDFIKVTFTDYTYVEKGESTVIPKLYTSDSWVAVPQPKSAPSGGKSKTSGAKSASAASKSGSSTKKPVAPAPTFSVVGHVKIASEVNGRFLRLRLKSGMPPGRQQLGYIMRLAPDPAAE
jgi:hypothetical protein